jgi:O-antigen/teichoic acid export membrane protein
VSAIKNLSWSASASLLGAALDVAKLIILARYIEPQYFAEFAIALVVVGFCQVFSEGGIGNAVVSKQTITKQQAGAVFNLSILVSIFIYLVMGLFTPFIADFYQSAVLGSLLPLILLVIPFSAVSSILQAVLQRELNIQAVAKAAVLGKLVSLICAWVLAIYDYGIWSLVWSTMAGGICTFLLLFIPGHRLIHFSASLKWVYLQPILGFSIYQLGELLLNFFAKNFDVLLITKLMGAEISGVYVVSKNLLTKGGDIVVSTFSRYFHPMMAKIQSIQTGLTESYLTFYRGVTFCIIVSYAFVAINTDLIVTGFLGDKFTSATEIFPFMLVWLIVRYWTAPVATLWLVKQKPHIGLIWNIVGAVLIPTSIWAARDFGIQGVLLALGLVQCVFLIISLVLTYFLLWRQKQPVIYQSFWLLTLIIFVSPFVLVSEYVWVDSALSFALSVLLLVIATGSVFRFRREFLG